MMDANNFEIGDHAHIGPNCRFGGNNIKIGDHFYCSGGLNVGGGGKNGPNANLTVGDRCTFHNNFINVCEPVEIGDDVGLSHEVSIITHGFWLSVLEGYPRKFEGVKIGNGVIVGYRSIILPGVEIADGCVIGAGSVVTKSLTRKGVYGGNPAKFIKEITPLTEDAQQLTAIKALREYKSRATHDGLNPTVEFMWPKVRVDDFWANLLTFEYHGEETNVTDHFRDYIRKWGIRIYTERGF